MKYKEQKIIVIQGVFASPCYSPVLITPVEENNYHLILSIFVN